MSATETLLAHLEAVKPTGAGRWLARCPAHADKRPSLSIRETDAGACLVHCWAGCSPGEIVAAAGMTMSDLFPPHADDQHAHRGERRPFPASDALRACSFEAALASVAASNLARGVQLTDADRDRLLLAASRLEAAARGAGL